ncbi:hypothetical protein IQ07DRAFT_583304 [Pyrenochaeta sp. DS3sAY3a]|nr:hypothetical protein IQ07DRAFT_583304 [Pyrenochaeta sp. DS3sAY3a]
MTDEILVHISAPTTRQNDSLYQSLANAYLEFEPARCYPDDLSQRDLGQSTNFNPPTTLAEGHSADLKADSSILFSSKDSYGSFPSYESNDNYGTNAHARASNGPTPTSSRLARLEHIHTTWKENTTPLPSAVTAQHSRSSPFDLGYNDPGFIEDTQLAAQALQSQLQDSYSITSDDYLDDDFSRETTLHNVVRPSYESDLLPEKGNGKAVASASPTSIGVSENFAGHICHITGQIYSQSLQSPSNQLCNEKVVSVTDIQHVSRTLDFSIFPLDGYPPAPQVSIECPGKLPSQITAHLARVATQNSGRFEPLQKTRTPDFDERGYWSLDCSNWPSMQQQEFWMSLHNEVLSGRLGWSTTLHRDPTNTRSLGIIKLYTWGEVVEHMWLVLWICSNGKIDGSRTKWYDADGFVVYKMP